MRWRPHEEGSREVAEADVREQKQDARRHVNAHTKARDAVKERHGSAAPSPKPKSEPKAKSESRGQVAALLGQLKSTMDSEASSSESGSRHECCKALKTFRPSPTHLKAIQGECAEISNEYTVLSTDGNDDGDLETQMHA